MAGYDDCKQCRSFHWASSMTFLQNKSGNEIKQTVDELNALPHCTVTATQIFPHNKGFEKITNDKVTEVQYYDCFIYYKTGVVIPKVI